jgi:hypothetical protein
LGLEHTYEALARALGYPPHFLKVKWMHNPELKLGLEGGKDILELLRELLYAVPSLVANLFRPRAAWRRAKLEDQVRIMELEARAAKAAEEKTKAEVGAAEALAQKMRADAEVERLKAEMQGIPIRADETANAVLSDVVEAITRAEPSHRLAFIGDTARYAVVAHSFTAQERVSLIPVSTPVTQRPVPSGRAGGRQNRPVSPPYAKE